MIIYDKTGEQILDIQVDDSSYRYRAIKQGDKVYLYFSLTEHVEIPLGAYVDYQGQRYILAKPENLTKHYSRNIEYTVEFWGWWELLYRTKYKLLSEKPHKLKFSLTATPQTFMRLMIDNLNLHDSGWRLGTCVEATEKLFSFSHESCIDVLNRLANEFNTEFEFEGKTIHFCKVEKFKDSPISLSYGKGKGFKSGVGRTNQGDKSPVTLLYVQGGERNIDRAKYNSPTLLLPKNQELEYQGRRYKTDPDGMYITRAEKDLVIFNEDSYDASNIYPSRVGEITGVETESNVDSDGNSVIFYNIIDVTIPDALNFRDCRLNGNRATIIFQSGKLAGREFDIMQSDSDLTGYNHTTRTFKLVSMQEDGIYFPNEHLCPSIGDKYAVFNISLPEAYVCDNVTKSGASWDMFREAVKYMYENENTPFTFKGELDSIHTKKNWLEIGSKLLPGGYVLFHDDQFQPEGINIRITGVKDYINKPYSPELELSNVPVGGFVSSELGKIDANEVTDADKHKQSIQYTKRRFRDAQETMSMLADALLTNFSESINPIAVATMQMLVGDESLQFRFVNSKMNPAVVNLNVTYNNDSKILSVPAGILQHMTLDIKEISSVHKYKFWDMGFYTSPYLEPDKKYYLYAKCSKNDGVGTFRISDKAIALEQEVDYYHFLVGALNSEYDGERSYVSLYGFTEILPGRIMTDQIVSKDGKTYFNLAQNEIGGNIKFISTDGSLKNVADTDKVACEAEKQTKEDLAKKLGYNNYAALETAAKAGSTIIEGAHIRTKLIDTDDLVCKNLAAVKGSIAGFSINGNGLSNTPFNNDAYVIFRNDTHKCFAGIGGNVLPTTSGLRSVARFENEDTSDWWEMGRNIAMYLSAKNGAYNHAFCGEGNGTLDGWIEGYKYSKLTLTKANTIYNSYSCLKDNNRWIIYSSVDRAGIILPKLSEVRGVLGIGTNTKFCVEFTVISDLDSRDFDIYGRNGTESNDGTYPWNTSEYPNLVHWDGDHWDSVPMGMGDSLTVLLIYDPNKGGTKGGYPLIYTARIINRQH